MVKSKNYRKVFKATAAIVAAVFLWDQILWASELAENTIQRLNESQAQLFAPAYLQNQQNVKDILVNQKQAMEDTISAQGLATSSNIEPLTQETVDLKGPIGGGSQSVALTVPDSAIDPSDTASSAEFSVTTQTGDVIYYVDGAIDRIEQPDGTMLCNIVVGQDGDLLSARIEYVGGTTQIVENGKLVRAVTSDGTVINYDPEEAISSVIYPDGAAVAYTYIRNEAGTLQGTITTDSEKTSYYTAAGIIEKTEYVSGKKLEYENGVLVSLKKEDGSLYLFRKKMSDDTITITLGSYTTADGWVFTLGDNGIIASVTAPTGGVTIYGASNALLSRNGNMLIVYSNDGGVKYIVEGREGVAASYIDPSSGVIVVPAAVINSLYDIITRLPEAARTVAAAEQIMSEKKSALDTAVNALDATSGAYASAVQDLSAAISQRQAAELRLTVPIGEKFLSYSYSPEAITVVTNKTLINEGCLSYSSSIWSKPANEYVNFTNGEILLQGTGVNNTAKIFARSRRLTPDISALSFDFKVDSSDGAFTASFDNINYSATEKRLSIVVKDGAVKVESNNASSQVYVATIINSVKINAYYTCSFDVSNGGIKIYIWEKGAQKPSAPAYTFRSTKSFCQPSFSVYSGKAWVDNIEVMSKQYVRRYDNVGRVINPSITPLPTSSNSSAGALKEAINVETSKSAIVNTAKSIRDKAANDELLARSVYEKAKTHYGELLAVENSLHEIQKSVEKVFEGLLVSFDTALAKAYIPLYSDSTMFVDILSRSGAMMEYIGFVRATYRISQPGLLKEVKTPVGEVIKYDENGVFINWDNSTVAQYSYLTDSSGALTGIMAGSDGLNRFYGIKGELKAIILDNGAKIEYKDGELYSVMESDGIQHIYTGGKLSQLIDTGGATFIFDSNNRPIRCTDKYHNTYEFTYTVDPNDLQEVVVIRDITKETTRYYKNDLLYRIKDGTGLLRDNTYYNDGKLKRTVIKYREKMIEDICYVYNMDGTVESSDSKNNCRIYSNNGKLISLQTPDGFIYKYLYPTSYKASMSLVQYKKDGAFVNYDPKLPAESQGISEELVVKKEYTDGALKKVYKADRTAVEYTYDGLVDKVYDQQGSVLTDYIYNDSSELIEVILTASRNELASAIKAAKTSIESEAAKGLKEIDRKQKDALLKADVAFMRENRSLIMQICSGNVSLKAFNEFMDRRKAIATSINAEANKVRAGIEDQIKVENGKIDSQKIVILAEIEKEEVSILIVDCYRAILGRDANVDEMTSWLSQLPESGKFSRSDICLSLSGSDEYSAKKTDVDRIKVEIHDYLNRFLACQTADEKCAFLARFGLNLSDVVTMNENDAEQILRWIDSQGLHFGQSAFKSLGALLEDGAARGDMPSMAVDTILIDILTGGIYRFSSGDITISMFAMTKFAEIKNAELSNVKMSFDDLTSYFTAHSGVKTIAHVDGNHYIVVTGIDEDGVHYRETNKGPGGTDETMSVRDFIGKWSGYTIMKESPADPTKVISAEEAKTVKGAFFGFIIAIVVAVFSAAAAVVSAVVSVATLVVSAVTAVISVFVSVATTFLTNIVVAISAIAVKISAGFQAAAFGMTGTFKGFFGASFFATFAKTALNTGLSFGIQAGLEAIGVNSTISKLTGAFLTGGVLGLLNPIKGVSTLGSFMPEALKYATIAGINELAPHLNLGANISGIISITAGAIVDGFWQGDIAGKLVKIAPNIAGEFAYYGVTRLGQELGIDASVSYLAGIGIRSSLQASLSSNMNPGKIWNSVVDGLLKGGTSIGLQWVYQELDMDPILGALSAAALTGAIEGLLEGQGAVKGAYDTLFKTGAGLLTLGDSGNNEWARASYISQVLDFSRIIKERGVVNALETYASGFLHQNAIDNIWKMGGIADLVTKKAEVVVNEEGVTVKRVYINPERTDFIDFSLAMDDMVGYKQGNILVDCPIEIGPDGRPTTDNGKIKVLLDGKSRIVYNIKDHNLILIEYIDYNGKTIAFAKPLDGENSIKMNEDDNAIRTGRFYNIEKQLIVDKRDNEVFRIISTPKSDMTEAELQELLSNGVEGRYLDGVTIEYDKNSNKIKVETDPTAERVGEFEGKTTFLSLISANGISSEFGKYAAPTYEERLRYRLSSQGVDENAIYLLPMFEGYGLPMSVRTVKDIGLWALDNAGTNILTNELIAKLDREIYSHILPGQQYEPKVMVLYSGSANPFFKAINKRHDFVIRDAIILGGPTLDGIFEDTKITNPNLNRVFNVFGTKDAFYPVAANKKYSGNVTPYNIEILGATHTDYFHDPTGGSLNDRSSYFVEEFLKVIYNKGNIDSFFRQHQVVYDIEKKIYIVDPYQIEYSPGFEWRNGE